jgi:hypothetical protein
MVNCMPTLIDTCVRSTDRGKRSRGSLHSPSEQHLSCTLLDPSIPVHPVTTKRAYGQSAKHRLPYSNPAFRWQTTNEESASL